MVTVQYSDEVSNIGVKSFIYGNAGVGKTPLCATAPIPLIISAEDGLLSIRRTHTAFIRIRNYADLLDAYNWVMQSMEARSYWTFCLDSLTEIAEVVLTEEKKKNKDPRKAYGEVLDQIIVMARNFRAVPRNVVIVAKEEYSKDESTGVMLYQPLMPGSKLSPRLPYFFDEVFRMVAGRDANQQQYSTLVTRPGFTHTARDRSGYLAEFERPDLTYVFKKCLGLQP